MPSLVSTVLQCCKYCIDLLTVLFSELWLVSYFSDVWLFWISEIWLLGIFRNCAVAPLAIMVASLQAISLEWRHWKFPPSDSIHGHLGAVVSSHAHVSPQVSDLERLWFLHKYNCTNDIPRARASLGNYARKKKPILPEGRWPKGRIALFLGVQARGISLSILLAKR